MTFDVHLVATLIAVVALVALDWVLGVLAAMRAGTFDLKLLPRQLETTVLPIIGSLVSLAVVQALASLLTSFGTETSGVFYAGAGAYAVRAVADIIDKVQAFGIGSPTPTTSSTTAPPRP